MSLQVSLKPAPFRTQCRASSLIIDVINIVKYTRCVLELLYVLISISTEAQLQENGIIMETPAFEEVIEVPMVSKLSRQEGDGEEEDERRKTPQLAFSENGSTHDLSTWDQSQVRDHAGEMTCWPSSSSKFSKEFNAFCRMTNYRV